MCISQDFPGFPVVKTVLPMQGSIPGWGTKIPHAARCGQNIKKKTQKPKVYFLKMLTSHTNNKWLLPSNSLIRVTAG